MQLIIDSPRLALSAHLQGLIHDKITHLEKMNTHVIRCRVVLKRVKNDHNKDSFIEAQLTLPRKIMFASEQADTFEIALDKIVDDLRNQLYHYKK